MSRLLVSVPCIAVMLRCLSLCALLPGFADAQVLRSSGDTVRVTLVQAEQGFNRMNVQLLASRYNVDAARAAVLQSNLWNNPNLAIEQNIYDPMTRRYFDFTQSGNTEIQLQQLFLLAGKRDKQIRLAEINTQIAENGLTNLYRALKLELRSDLFDLYFLQKTLQFYDESVAAVRKTVDAMGTIFQQRSILLSEVLRLKSLLLTLQTERMEILNQIAEKEGSLRVLLRDTASAPTYFVPLLDTSALDGINIDTLSLQRAVAAAMENRPDLRAAVANVKYAEANLSLQNALAVPDLTIGGRWSRAGSYIPDYFAVSVAVDLPLFNRNQDNILISEKALEANRLIYENTREVVEQEVVKAFSRAKEADNLYRSFDSKFTGQYRTLVDGMIASYQQRNISIVQFTDFYESYRTSVIQMNQLQNSRLDAFEELDYSVGMGLINP